MTVILKQAFQIYNRVSKRQPDIPLGNAVIIGEQTKSDCYFTHYPFHPFTTRQDNLFRIY